MSGLTVRASTEADVARCAEIYGHHVLHGTASFEVDPPDLAEMRKRRAAVLDLGLPYIVAEKQGRLLGYAYAGLYRPLEPLIDLCTRDGRRQMIAVIGDSAHVASIKLHASCGFAMVGTLKSVGFKFGRWLDSVLMERPLGPGDTKPPETGE